MLYHVKWYNNFNNTIYTKCICRNSNTFPSLYLCIVAPMWRCDVSVKVLGFFVRTSPTNFLWDLGMIGSLDFFDLSFLDFVFFLLVLDWQFFLLVLDFRFEFFLLVFSCFITTSGPQVKKWKECASHSNVDGAAMRNTTEMWYSLLF